jgi:hypothetical protein
MPILLLNLGQQKLALGVLRHAIVFQHPLNRRMLVEIRRDFKLKGCDRLQAGVLFESEAAGQTASLDGAPFGVGRRNARERGGVILLQPGDYFPFGVLVSESLESIHVARIHAKRRALRGNAAAPGRCLNQEFELARIVNRNAIAADGP